MEARSLFDVPSPHPVLRVIYLEIDEAADYGIEEIPGHGYSIPKCKSIGQVGMTDRVRILVVFYRV